MRILEAAHRLQEGCGTVYMRLMYANVYYANWTQLLRGCCIADFCDIDTFAAMILATSTKMTVISVARSSAML